MVRLDAESLEYMVRRYTGNALLFAIEILNRQWDSWQQEALLASTKARRLSRSAGHGVGKTWVAGAIAIHRICTMPESQTICTSATYAQLTTRLWPTILKLIQGSKIPNWFECTSETIRIKGLQSSWIKAQPWNRSNSESFAGLHPKSPALLADESSAIDDVIFEAFEGSMQHQNSFLGMFGNPLYRHGALWDSANAKRGLYDYASVSCIGSMHSSPEWIQEMRDTYGDDNDVFRTRVLGQFPTSEQQGFIGEALVRAAIGRKVMPDYKAAVVGGLDVARYGGDVSCLILRRAAEVIFIKTWKKFDTMDLSEEVSKLMIEHKCAILSVDGHGLGGGPVDRLKKLQPGKISEINNLGADGGRDYYNRRSKLWGDMRDWLNYGSLPNDKDLITDLTGLLYSYDKQGRFQLEGKKEAAKRGVGSPDCGDALAYSFAATVAPIGTDNGKTHVRNEVAALW